MQPFTPSKQNAINNDNTDSNNSGYLNISVILGALIGILFALTLIVCIYGIRFYLKTKKRKMKSKRHNNEEGRIEGKNENEISDDIIIQDHTPFKPIPIPSIIGSSITTNTININEDINDDDPYLEDDKFIQPGYYLTKLQKGYISTDNDDTNDDDIFQNENENENDEKLQIISSIDDNPSSDSNDNRSVISSIISFRKRKKNKNKNIIKHQRAKTIEIKLKNEPKRKRSFHWGFTNNGSDIRYKNGENVHSLNDLHSKSHTSHIHKCNAR